MTTAQKKRLLKAKMPVALRDELGRVPTQKEINQVFLLTKVMYQAVLDCTTEERNKRRAVS